MERAGELSVHWQRFRSISSSLCSDVLLVYGGSNSKVQGSFVVLVVDSSGFRRLLGGLQWFVGVLEWNLHIVLHLYAISWYSVVLRWVYVYMVAFGR